MNKKKQKNFFNLGRGGFTAPGPNEQKFLRRFFQKAATFLSILWLIPAEGGDVIIPADREMLIRRCPPRR